MAVLVIMAVVIAALCGCAKKHVLIIPNTPTCPIKVREFTKVCKPTPSGDAMCDGVRIHYDCIDASQHK